MDLFISELFARKKAAEQTFKDLTIAIETIQKVCDHPKWVEAGHDSHHSYKACDRCGHEVSY